MPFFVTVNMHGCFSQRRTRLITTLMGHDAMYLLSIAAFSIEHKILYVKGDSKNSTEILSWQYCNLPQIVYTQAGSNL